MKYQAYTLTVELKELWERAFNREVIIVDFTDKPEAIIQCQAFWTALCNYRRKVRNCKLNPLYKDEWSRIERATLRRINLTSFCLHRKNKASLSNGRRAMEHRLPWNDLEFPNSVTYLQV
jgi:hypothetical protein